MQLYRACLNNGGGGEDYSATYTATINGEIQKGGCFRRFAGDNTFNEAVTIGDNVIQCSQMFIFANNFGNDVYIKGKTYRNINVYWMFTSTPRFNQRINIHFNNVLTPIFYNNNNGSALVGSGGAITWTNTTNCFYNTAYNIYCYNNYEG